MKTTKYLQKITVLAILLFQLAVHAQTTNPPSPRAEKLLNGLKLLVWSDKNAPKVSVTLRIHSGAAFDPQSKEGVMALLGDILFPNEIAREYFTEDLGGNLEITSTYDYIQIAASGDNDKILEILEALAQAVARPQIDKDTTAKIKKARLELVAKLEKDPAYVADQAVAKRLFGNYPYGRPQTGTTESLTTIDFADLLLAKQKFLTADNATLAVSGNVKFDLVFRAVRRYFGGWEKADKKIPPTFTQPEAPKSGLPVFESPVEKTSEFRFAFRGLARNEKDFYAAQILANILQDRFQTREGKTSFVRLETRVLPGFFVFGVSGWNVSTIKRSGNQISLPMTDGYQNYFLKDAVKPEEFERSKTEFLAKLNQTNVSDFWLDADTYKIASVKADWESAQNITIADVQRVLEKLQKEPVAYVLFFSGEKPKETPANQ